METQLIGFATTALINLVGLGIFIGRIKSSQDTTKETLKRVEDRLQRIEDKTDKQNEEMAQLRERVAIIENILEIRRKTT